MDKALKVTKNWGTEKWYSNVNENGVNYCGKILELKKGYKASFHCHKIKDETFHVISGLLRMRLENEVFFMGPGDSVRLKPNTYHSFMGMEDTTILEASTFHSDEDVYRKEPSSMIEGDVWQHIFDKKHILVIGDIILDEYVYGTVDRISPEAPIPVHKVASKEYRLGGAANVAVNLVNLGQDVTLMGMVGRNNYTIKNLLDTYYISDHALVQDLSRPTTIKTRIIAKHHHIVRIDEEDIKPLDDSFIETLNLPLNPDLVIFSDYNKGFLTPKLISKVMEEYKGKCPIIVDPKTELAKFKGVDIIKPNMSEFKAMFTDTPESVMNKYDFNTLIITMSEKGFGILKKGHKEIQQYPIYDSSIVPVDITGAGDTYTATLGTAIATGYSIEESAWLANFASGITIKHMGTYAPTLSEFSDYKPLGEGIGEQTKTERESNKG